MGNHLSLTASVMMSYWGNKIHTLGPIILKAISSSLVLGSHRDALALGISMHWQPSDGELA